MKVNGNNKYGVRKWLHALLITSVAAVAGTAHATVITSSGDNNPLGFTWDYDTGSSHLTGSGTMTVSGFNTSLLTVQVSLSNTSLIGGKGGERLTSFGFGIDPNATGVAFGDVGDGGLVNASMASIPGLATIEVCAWGGPNCSGGGNGGIYAGTSDSFTILLAGSWGSSVNIAPIGFKYQTGYGSFEFTSSTTTDRPVPEPTTLSLLGISLLALALLGRYRRRRQAAL